MRERARRYTRKAVETYQKINTFLRTYERWLLPAVLIVGLVVDFFTFRAVNIQTAGILLAVHIALATIAIMLVNSIQESSIQQKILPVRYARIIAPFVVQFSFGALLSASFIFYWYSGALSVSWPLLLIVLFLMIGNDVFREHYQKPTAQISILFFAIFSVLSIFLPFIFSKIGFGMILAAGAIAAVYTTAVSTTLLKTQKNTEIDPVKITSSIAIISLMFIGAYLTNISPPIPLAIRDAGVYHSITRGGSVYSAQKEVKPFWKKLFAKNTTTFTQGEPIFIYTAIFAPKNINIPIYHRWQKKVDGKWVNRDRIAFTIAGGRQDGFRGYTRKTALEEGTWRVRVETSRGQVLGTIRFKLESGEATLEEVSL